jgi:hypothetical protein
MKICLKNLKEISESFERGDTKYFLEFINSFDGDNIYKKFIKILKSWELDVAHSMSLTLGDKNTKITIAYVIDCMSGLNSDETIPIKWGDWEFHLGTPEKFTDNDGFELSETIKLIRYKLTEIDVSKLSISDRDSVVGQLPAGAYNAIINVVMSSNKFIGKMDNPALEHVNINFLNNSAYTFLCGLFDPYEKDYYRDIIYYLSRKIDGELLMNSTIMDIEYYMEKMNVENSERDSLDLY